MAKCTDMYQHFQGISQQKIIKKLYSYKRSLGVQQLAKNVISTFYNYKYQTSTSCFVMFLWGREPMLHDKIYKIQYNIYAKT